MTRCILKVQIYKAIKRASGFEPATKEYAGGYGWAFNSDSSKIDIRSWPENKKHNFWGIFKFNQKLDRIEELLELRTNKLLFNQQQ